MLDNGIFTLFDEDFNYFAYKTSHEITLEQH